MKKKIIIFISFNTLPFGEDRFEESWINSRLDIFMKYTLHSLINQTNNNFSIILSYCCESEFIFLNSLKKYYPLPSNLILSKISRKVAYESTINGFMFESDEILKICKGYDFVYISRIDSDDMYYPYFIQDLIDFNPKQDTKVIINKNGYIYDIKDDILGRWTHSSPPFFTFVYKVDDYINGVRYKLDYGHCSAIKLPHEFIVKRSFMVIVHENNTSTTFNNPSTTSEILDLNKKNSIMDIVI